MNKKSVKSLITQMFVKFFNKSQEEEPANISEPEPAIEEEQPASKTEGEAVQALYSPSDEEFLKQFDKIVNENISDSGFGVKNLTKEMKMSRTSIYNKVRALTGLNLKEYMIKIHIGYAMKLLRETNLPIAKIAEKSGFSCPRYFSTAFKAATGNTPSHYRKEK